MRSTASAPRPSEAPVARSSGAQSSRAIGLILAGAALFYAAFIARSTFSLGGRPSFTLFDDAMISMRFARNLADGFGLVWNPGEAPVEGYTNLLWTLWMSVWHMSGLREGLVALPIMISGAIILLANTYLVWLIGMRIAADRPRLCLLAAGLSAFYYPLVFWTLRGMEVGLLTMLVNCALLAATRYEREQQFGAVLAAILVLSLGLCVRPDAVVPFLVIGAFFVVVAPEGSRIRIAALFVLTLMVVMGGLTLFRLRYYHYPLPNTYYLKMTGVSPVVRVTTGIFAFAKEFVLHLGGMLLVAAPAIAFWRDRRITLLAMLALSMCAYSAFVGGDAWEHFHFANRYITVGMPALLLLAVLVTARLSELRSSDWRFVGRVALAVSGVMLSIFALAIYRDSILKELDRGAQVPAMKLHLLWFVEGVGAGLLIIAFLGKTGRVLSALPSVVQRYRSGGMVLVAIAYLWCNAVPLGRWSVRNAEYLDEDQRVTTWSVALRQALSSDASFAASWMGAPGYYVRRRAIDLLGKNDTVIAHMASTAKFLPGHNKYNYAYSIGRLRPDLVLDLRDPNGLVTREMRTWGYVPVNGWWVRQDSKRINIAALPRPDARLDIQ